MAVIQDEGGNDFALVNTRKVVLDIFQGLAIRAGRFDLKGLRNFTDEPIFCDPPM